MLASVIRDLMKSGRKSKDATAAKLRRLMPACPVCNTKTDSHRYALIAAASLGEHAKSRVTQLISHVRSHGWDALRSLKEWKGNRDNAGVYAISGPHDAGVIILVRGPYELYENTKSSCRKWSLPRS
jgi:hypothetical protein